MGLVEVMISIIGRLGPRVERLANPMMPWSGGKGILPRAGCAHQDGLLGGWSERRLFECPHIYCSLLECRGLRHGSTARTTCTQGGGMDHAGFRHAGLRHGNYQPASPARKSTTLVAMTHAIHLGHAARFGLTAAVL